MSIARARRGPRARQGGFSFVEIVVVTGILAGMTLVLERTLAGVTESQRLLESMRATTQAGHQVAYRLRDVVQSSRRLFGNDAEGQAYLDRLALNPTARILGSRLPTFDETNPLGPDVVGDPRTGNVLLFVREAPAAVCIADPATRRERHVDTFRFYCLYLTQSARAIVAGGPGALDLVDWRSVAYPSYSQVMQIANVAERTVVALELRERYGFDWLWDPAAPAATAFYSIDAMGAIAALGSTPAEIPEDRNVSRGGGLVPRGTAVARTDATSRPRASVFTRDDPVDWVPEGFEVKIVGASGARKVWMRITVERQASAGRVPAQQTTVVATTRDI